MPYLDPTRLEYGTQSFLQQGNDPSWGTSYPINPDAQSVAEALQSPASIT